MSSYIIPEILDKVCELDGTIDEKAALLKTFSSKSLRWFVDVMYNAKELGSIQIPDYVPSSFPIGNAYMNLNNCLGKLEAIIACKGETVQSQKNLLIILQNVHAREAELIVHLLKGRKVEGVPKSVFKQTFPEFFRPSAEASLDEAFE